MSGQNIESLYDVVVIGGGPAGLTAAVYLARAKYRVVVLEKESFGGQITITSEVVNYPGVIRTEGKELTETMRRQAENFGAEFLLAEAVSIDIRGDVKKVRTDRGELSCFGILLATGAHPRMIGFPGEEEFKGHGVAYCATCDGEFFTGKEVFVVGGGFAAAEESVFLTKYAKHVTVLVREPDFTCAKAVAEGAKNHEKITVHYNTEVEYVKGDSMLREIAYRNHESGERSVFRTDGDTFGVFVFAGYAPATELIRGIADCNEQGYVVTDRDQQTSAEGLYAAGDVCIKSLRQVVTAVGDGALAATELERYAAHLQKKTGMIPKPKQSVSGKAEHHGNARQTSGKETFGTASEQSGVFSEEILLQLEPVFEKMERPLLLKLFLDDRPVSHELEHYIKALAELTDKLTVEVEKGGNVPETPYVTVCYEDGTDAGLAFHGVPGGHEFTSFILGLYNAAGPGQAVEPELLDAIRGIDKKTKMKIMVSLSCTMCPELVTAAERIAAENPQVTVDVYDLNHFPDMKDKYQVMSVPCMVINDGKPLFGKKNIRQLMELL